MASILHKLSAFFFDWSFLFLTNADLKVQSVSVLSVPCKDCFAMFVKFIIVADLYLSFNLDIAKCSSVTLKQFIKYSAKFIIVNFTSFSYVISIEFE